MFSREEKRCIGNKWAKTKYKLLVKTLRGWEDELCSNKCEGEQNKLGYFIVGTTCILILFFSLLVFILAVTVINDFIFTIVLKDCVVAIIVVISVILLLLLSLLPSLSSHFYYHRVQTGISK